MADVLVFFISACHIVIGGLVFNWDNILDLTVAAEIVSLIPISFYNGKRGLRQKYFFYVFYPLHLLLLYGCMLLIMRML
ncbi:TraX family protein [Agathobacter sp.]|uniref:TraX family protein n=1 Tax=Agathobacter sp. TaxID=2021311 RepID=UPI003FA47A65